MWFLEGMIKMAGTGKTPNVVSGKSDYGAGEGINIKCSFWEE
jgi:hypothetical protein